MPKGFKEIGSAIESIYSDMGLAAEYALGLIRRKWVSIVGDTLAHHSEPLSISNGEFLIKVSSSAWAEEFKFNSFIILERLNSLPYIQKFKINKLKFRLGRIKGFKNHIHLASRHTSFIPENRRFSGDPTNGVSDESSRTPKNPAIFWGDNSAKVLDLPASLKEFIEASVSSINDERLKDSIKRAMEKSLIWSNKTTVRAGQRQK